MPRRNLFISERKQLINDVENGLSKFDASKRFKVDISSVFRVLNNSMEINNAATNGLGKRTRLEKNEEILEHDKRVKDFVLLCQDRGVPITAKIICEKGIEIARQMQREDLKCTSRWFSRFKDRIGLKYGVLNGEKKGVDLTVVKEWKEVSIPRIMINWQSEFIYNCDETGLFRRQLPVKTYFIRKTEHSGDKIFSERLSILHCVNCAGDRLPLLVIGKSSKPRAFYKGCLDDLQLTYKAQVNAWMTRNIFDEWLQDFHTSLVEQGKKILLLLDNFSGHKVNFSNYPQITFQFLPPGTTCYTQPLDAGIIKAFKSKYYHYFINHILENVQSCQTVKDIVKNVDILQSLKWASQSWVNISSETIVNCWSHCGYIQLDELQESMADCASDDLDNVLADLGQLSLNTCSSSELLSQISFDYVNYFDQ